MHGSLRVYLQQVLKPKPAKVPACRQLAGPVRFKVNPMHELIPNLNGLSVDIIRILEENKQAIVGSLYYVGVNIITITFP